MIDTRTQTIVTFGDSVLDSGSYSGTTAGEIIAKAMNRKLLHLARDGATIHDIEMQWKRFESHTVEDPVAMVSVGGNDFIMTTNPFKWDDFVIRMAFFLAHLKKNKIKTYVANVYDPTFGDDSKDFLGIPWNLRPEMRKAYAKLNDAIAGATAYAGGTLVDLHAHFLKGDPSWFARTIEPSARGAEEVARAFMEKM